MHPGVLTDASPFCERSALVLWMFFEGGSSAEEGRSKRGDALLNRQGIGLLASPLLELARNDQ